ncbi:alpha/beta hydrolase [Novosphingobium sp. 1949]|uniref:Alpha/beta hydrolase n=1 Tax=Novosphingobium organovorum TaxID=2930092 RepID=A0ABT0BG61_9SPHN|nr:alpha/beta fold hydrolase [Novosphingobium organovorum]MCJ2184016.1 alpha/beta hydrolase [Novosphingobium organovorum]
MPDPRQPLVLVPGLACNQTVWEAQVAALADVAQVTIGDTLSDPSIPAMAQRILATAPARFALAGFSMGGYVTMEIWRQAPERITRIAFVDTTAGADDADALRLREAAIATAEARSLEAVLRGSLQRLVHPSAPREVAERVVAMALDVGLERFAIQQRAIQHRPDSHADLASVAVPALILAGAQDRLIAPERLERLHRTIPAARLALIADCGHMAPMEKPAEVTRHMRGWLAA